MTTYVSESMSAAELTVRRLGERTCVINVGTELRHVALAVVEEAVSAATHDGSHDMVFDLSLLRRYDSFALVRLAREWDRLADAGCLVHVAARDPRVLADLQELADDDRWTLHRSTVAALRALLSAPVD
jgi:anti-anti-sigma regulatory factor